MVKKRRSYRLIFIALITLLVSTIYIKRKFKKPATVKKIKKAIKKLEQPKNKPKVKPTKEPKKRSLRSSQQQFRIVTEKAQKAGIQCDRLDQKLKNDGILDKSKILDKQKLLNLFNESFLQKIAPNYNNQIIDHTFSKQVDAESAYDFFFNYKLKAKHVCLPLKWIVYLHKIVKRDKELKEQALELLKLHFERIFTSKSLFNEARNYAITLNGWACLQSKEPFSFCNQLKPLTRYKDGRGSLSHQLYERIKESEENAEFNKQNYDDFIIIIRQDIEHEKALREQLKLYFDEYLNSL